MVKIEKTVRIEAPVDRVFDYVTDPNRLPEIWPSLVEVSNVERDESGKHSFDWTYKMAGLRFHGRADTIEVQRNRLALVRNEGGIPSTFKWTYTESGGGTDLRLEIEYELPGKLIEKLAEPFVRRLNEREAETMLGNLKTRFELGEGAGSPS